MIIHRFTGRVVDQTPGASLDGIRAEVWDAESRSSDLVAFALTDESGVFTIRVDSDDLQALLGDPPYTLSFRLFRGTDGGGSQLRTTDVLWRPTPAESSGRFEVQGTASGSLSPSASVVRGVVQTTAGAAVGGALVKALDAGLSSEVLLGQATTDARGRYAIQYTPWSGAVWSAPPNLVVRAYVEGAEVAASSILCHAPPTATVDLTQGGAFVGPAEHDALWARVSPVLGTFDLTTATAVHIERIACSTNSDAAQVSALVGAATLHALMPHVPREIFYGLVREGLPATQSDLLFLAPSALRAALQSALDKNTVPSSFGGSALTDTMALLRQEAIALVFPAGTSPPTTPIGAVLKTVLEEADAQSFLDAYLAHDGPIDAFWGSLDTGTFPSDKVADLQFALQVGALARLHLPLVKKLQELRSQGTVPSFLQVAWISESTWLTILDMLQDGSAVGFPADVPGTTDAERKAGYARYLKRTMETLFPTASIAGEVGPGTDQLSQDLTTFFLANQSFEFDQHRVDEYLVTNPNALNGVAAGNRDAATKRLRHMERLFKLTPRYSEMQILLDAGLHSAREVMRLGHDAFLTRYAGASGPLSTDVAEEIFANARHTAAHALGLHAKFGAAMNPKSAYALPDLSTRSQNADPGQDANWSTIFGSPDFCDCEECASVYGAAAYFVDLLQFLGRHDSNVVQGSATLSAKDVLLGRRPDLAHIELTCQNTDTPLPYIDLVNEILEYVVAAKEHNQPLVFPSHIKTGGSPEELRALPEILDNGGVPTPHEDAYTILAQKVYPWSLPFDLATTEARTYLAHLGVPRGDLMLTLQRVTPGAPTTYAPSPAEVAAERLGLSPAERKVITDQPFPGSTLLPSEQFYGLTDPNQLAQLASVASLMKLTGATYDEILDFVDSSFLHQFGSPSISPADACDVTAMTLVGLNEQQIPEIVDRIHRFFRLLRRRGYSIREMDQLVTAFNTTIDEDFLIGLATVERLRARFGLPVPVVASWFGDLDTQRRDQDRTPSFYEQVFQNKSVQNPPDAQLSSEAIKTSTQLLTDKVDALIAALRVTTADFALLTNSSVAAAQLGEPTAVLAGALVSLQNLSTLYRLVTFAQALGLSIRDLLILDKLSGKPLTSPTTGRFRPADLEVFLQTVDRVRSSGFTAPELLSLFANYPAPAVPTAPDAIDATLDALFSELVKIYHQQIVATDTQGDQLAALLGTVMDDASAQTIKSFVTSGVTPGTPAQDPGQYFDAALAPLCWDPATVKTRLLATAIHTDADVAERATLAYAHMGVKIRGLIHVAQAFGAAVKLDASLMLPLLRDTLTSSTGATLADAFSLPGTTAAPFAEPYSTPSTARDDYLHLARTATVIRRLGVTIDELGVYRSTDGSLSQPAKLFDFDALPRGSSSTTATGLFASFQTLIDVTGMRALMARGGVDLAALLRMTVPAGASQSTVDVFTAAAAAALPWSANDVDTLVKPGGLNLIITGPVSCAASLLRLRDAFAALKRLGVSAARALEWVQPMDLNASAQVVQTAKSKHTEAEWNDVAPPLRDVLRDKQRNALIDYLIFKQPYTDADALFGDLLIDVEMAPIQLTSRIKQAIASVQTFVQRALLNLEPSVALSDTAAREWPWRKSYRLWEANRQVFLYPENWILPELRDDKSPFFQELEQALRQKDITDDAAEDAMADYLGKLERVSRLEVMASYHQVEDGDLDHSAIDVLHVIARTRSTPHELYYRTRVDGTRWTAWERVDLEVESDQMMLAVVDRRLRLFWPLVETKADDEQPIPGPNQAGTRAQTHLEIKLAWSEYHNRKWSTQQVSKGDPVTLRLGPQVSNPSRWISLALDTPVFVLASGYSVLCLFDPSAWIGTAQAPIILGTFAFDACRGPVGTFDRGAHMTLSIAGGKSWIDYSDNANHFGPQTLELGGPQGMILDGQDEVLPAGGGWSTLTLDVVEQNILSPTKILNTPGSSRFLAPHWVVDSTTGLRPANAETDHFFVKDGGTTYFAELETLRSKTEWRIGMMAQVYFPTVLSHKESRLGATVAQWASKPPVAGSFTTTVVSKGYRFQTFYHPYACDFLSELHRGGVPGLLRWPATAGAKSVQFTRDDTRFAGYGPQSNAVASPYPAEEVDFSFGGAYSLYNWEVFFHIPFLVAVRLMENQRFEEARKWFHYVFDPTSGASAGKSPQRFWKVRPFYQNSDLASIQDELKLLASQNPPPASPAAQLVQGLITLGESQERRDLEAQVAAWEADPFNPHLIARMRPLAYQKAVVMKYIENLIGWGDQLFRSDTLEAINEATQLYILAGQLLGPRPVNVHPASPPVAKTYAELEALDMGALSDPLLESESLVSVGALQPQSGTSTVDEPPPDLGTLVFCVPPDAMLLGLWDTVADRLFKIRHSMNIEGVVRQLPLFEPPIDPGLLVAARAAGVDLRSLLDEVNPILPNYRFSFMHAKAMELCSSVVSLGSSLLAALEKKDGEGLSRLRAGQEVELLAAVREVKRSQLQEAQQSLAGLQRALEVATLRHDYYANVPKLSDGEILALGTGATATVLGAVAQGLSAAASTAKGFPTVTFGGAGWAGSPVTVTMAGGGPTGDGLDSAAGELTMAASVLRDTAAMQAQLAGYERRWDDYKLQERLAAKEMQQIQKQIAAANIRVAIAEKELENHDLQMDHAKAVDAYLRDKFTNDDLYDWMVGQLSTVYFQGYQLAYDVAKRVEKAYRFERAVERSNYIAFGYWDSLKKGLLAGERLQSDLRTLEVAYLEQNTRELEIVKHVSLASLDPAALMTLRETGTCNLTIGEDSFDFDYPGHYLRRIKSVSVTIPTVSGPYTGVSCTLRLNSSSVRVSSTVDTTTPANAASSYPRTTNDGRFSDSYVPVVATIATSSGQNDSGLFEPNLRDERYLPFEGAGAIESKWTLSLPRATNGFDIATIGDVVLHLRYTARDGGQILADAARTRVVKAQEQGSEHAPAWHRLFSIRSEFPDAWAQFINTAQGDPSLVLPIDASMFPYLFGNGDIKAIKMTVYAHWNGSTPYSSLSTMVGLTVAGPGISGTATPTALTEPAGVPSNTGKWSVDLPDATPGTWTITVNHATFPQDLRDTLQDVWVLLDYRRAVPTWA